MNSDCALCVTPFEAIGDTELISYQLSGEEKKNHAIQITCSEKRNSLIGKTKYKSIMENDVLLPSSTSRVTKLVYHLSFLHTDLKSI